MAKKGKAAEKPAADKVGRYPRTLYGLRGGPNGFFGGMGGVLIETDPSPSVFVGTGKHEKGKVRLAVYELVGFVTVEAGVTIGPMEEGVTR